MIKEIFATLLKRVEDSSLPEGVSVCGIALEPNTKSWIRMKFDIILGMTDEEVIEHGLIPEWTAIVDNLLQ